MGLPGINYYKFLTLSLSQAFIFYIYYLYLWDKYGYKEQSRFNEHNHNVVMDSFPVI